MFCVPRVHMGNNFLKLSVIDISRPSLVIEVLQTRGTQRGIYSEKICILVLFLSRKKVLVPVYSPWFSIVSNRVFGATGPFADHG